MRYSDETACCGCVCHRTIAFSDCYHDLSTLRSAMHRTCTHNAPCAGDARVWVGPPGGVAMRIRDIWEAFNSALGPRVRTE